jgi:GWxTD domain-containing protein
MKTFFLILTFTVGLTAWQTSQSWPDEDVAYIIKSQERAAFKALQTDDERKIFIKQFWDRRNPTPGTEENKFKEEHYRRMSYANAHYPSSAVAGWKTDRGRVYIIYGPPDEIESHPGGGGDYNFPYEQWLYRHISIGDDVVFEFVDPESKGDFRENTFKRLGPGVPLLKDK